MGYTTNASHAGDIIAEVVPNHAVDEDTQMGTPEGEIPVLMLEDSGNQLRYIFTGDLEDMRNMAQGLVDALNNHEENVARNRAHERERIANLVQTPAMALLAELKGSRPEVRRTIALEWADHLNILGDPESAHKRGFGDFRTQEQVRFAHKTLSRYARISKMSAVPDNTQSEQQILRELRQAIAGGYSSVGCAKHWAYILGTCTQASMARSAGFLAVNTRADVERVRHTLIRFINIFGGTK